MLELQNFHVLEIKSLTIKELSVQMSFENYFNFCHLEIKTLAITEQSKVLRPISLENYWTAIV